jgi:transposase InsO family protein
MLLSSSFWKTIFCPGSDVHSKSSQIMQQVFKSKNMEKFCNDYNITLGHSTSYYPQGNGLAESSNKSLTKIYKKVVAR